MRVRVSEKGQVTIPKRLRDRLGIVVGDVLDFEEERGRLVATRLADDPVARLYGSLRLPAPTDVLMEEMRGPRKP